jgi:hypothetical protein
VDFDRLGVAVLKSTSVMQLQTFRTQGAAAFCSGGCIFAARDEVRNP